MSKKDIKDLLTRFKDKTPEEILEYFLPRYSALPGDTEGVSVDNPPEGSPSPDPGEDKGGKGKPRDRIALASSLGPEDQVLTHMVLAIKPDARIFVLDTGRFHQETYDLMGRTMKQYNMHYEILFPNTADVEKMESTHGPDLFFENIGNRKLCCSVRKIKPLRRILSTLDAWITGLRKEQSITRDGIKKIEWDEGNDLIKINPLADWSDADVWEYIRKHNVPYNILHDRCYPSIGCAPCTRAVLPGEDIRAGRWWWETPEQKECGLHVVNGNLVRKKG
jgi:phosphoadenosine phosphosulfate reductase